MKFMRTMTYVLVGCAIVNATGCAYMFLPNREKITLNADHPNSKVFVDNEEVGEGQAIKTKIKKDGVKQVVVQTPGYKDAHQVLVQNKRHAAFWPLMVLDIPLVYGLIFDAMPMPKYFKFPKTNNVSSGVKYNNKTANERYIQLEAIKLNVADKDKDLTDYYNIKHSANLMEDMQKAEQSKVKTDQKLAAKSAKKSKKKSLLTEDDKGINYDDTKFSEVVYKTLKKTGYIDTVNKLFVDNNSMVLEGVIKKASVFHISGAGYATYKKAKVNITWNIKNSFGEVIDSINDWSYSGDFINSNEDKGEKMFADAVDNSYLNLKKNKTFTRNLLIDTNFAIKEPILAINAPKQSINDVSDASAATVTIKRATGGHGSGFAISNDGYILTNFHVIAGENVNKLESLTVLLSTGEELPVTVVRYNRMRDIALLKVNKTFDKAFNLSTVKSFKNLMEVYTVGTPKSIELGQSVSLGLISNERKTSNNNLLQLSMNINPGNSGGPLFEKNGTLQGVVTSKLVGYATEGVGFAIPSYLIPDYLNISLN